MTYNPIVEKSSALYEAILLKIASINNQLSDVVYNQNKLDLNFSLLAGRTGVVICLLNSYRLIRNEYWFSKLLNDYYYILEFELKNNLDFFTFCNGSAGVGWAALYLQSNLKEYGIDDLDDETLNRLDAELQERTLIALKGGNFDYLHGGLSGVIYFLDRLQSLPGRNEYLADIVRTLSNIAIENNEKGEIMWDSNYDGTSVFEFNLGLAHGIPSVICLLSLIKLEGVAPENCASLIEKSINWLLAQKKTKGSSASLFPSILNDAYDKSRLAWCYGDLGIAICLLHASKATNNDSWRKEAINIAQRASERRDFRSTLVYDACICHGTSGLILIYNMLYQETHIEDFRLTALFWIEETLKMSLPIGDEEEFKFWEPGENDSAGAWVNTYGLLEGLAGVSLALQAAVAPQYSKWTRALLIS